MLKLEFSGQFKKDYKLAVKRGCDPNSLKTVVSILQREEKLPDKYRDHALSTSKKYKNVRECHIEPDWLLIYKLHDEILTLELVRTGKHSDLF